MHGIGKNIKHYGADHVDLGHRLPVVGLAAVGDRRVQALPDLATRSCEKFGYKKLTKEDKAKIFGLNAAKIYSVDVKAKRKALPGGRAGEARSRVSGTRRCAQNAAYGWVRAERLVKTVVILSLLACTAALAQTTPAEQMRPLAHFHHVHLNTTDPAAAILFYTSKFKARKESYAGLGDAIWTGDSWAAVHEGRRPAAE